MFYSYSGIQDRAASSAHSQSSHNPYDMRCWSGKLFAWSPYIAEWRWRDPKCHLTKSFTSCSAGRKFYHANFTLYRLPVIPLETMQHWMINEVISHCAFFPTRRANLTKKTGELICSLSSKWIIRWRILEMCNNHPVFTELDVLGGVVCVIDWIVSVLETGFTFMQT